MKQAAIYEGSVTCSLSTSNGLPRVFVYLSTHSRHPDFEVSVGHRSKAFFAGRAIGPCREVHPGFERPITTEDIKQLCAQLFPNGHFQVISDRRFLQYGFDRYDKGEHLG